MNSFNKLEFPIVALMPANDNATYPAVISQALTERPGSLEAATLRAWSRRDPLDAAMAAYALHRRLRFGDEVIVTTAPRRPDVDRLVKDWTSTYPPAVFLAASERLLDVLSRWADEEISAPNLPHLKQ